MKIQNIILLIVTFLGGTIVYALDWQREQDERAFIQQEKLNNLDKMIEKQSLILDTQIMINKEIKNRGLLLLSPPKKGESDGR